MPASAYMHQLSTMAIQFISVAILPIYNTGSDITIWLNICNLQNAKQC